MQFSIHQTCLSTTCWSLSGIWRDPRAALEVWRSLAFLACCLLALPTSPEAVLMAETRLLDILARQRLVRCRVRVECKVQTTDAENQTPLRVHNGRQGNNSLELNDIFTSTKYNKIHPLIFCLVLPNFPSIIFFWYSVKVGEVPVQVFDATSFSCWTKQILFSTSLSLVLSLPSPRCRFIVKKSVKV